MKFFGTISLLLGAALAASGYDFVRYENEASRVLSETEAECRRTPDPVIMQFSGAVTAAQVGNLLKMHLARGFALPGDWFTNEDGSIVVLLREPGCGAIIREFCVYRLSDGMYHHTGTYRVLSRAHNWKPEATRFEMDGAGVMVLRFVSSRGITYDCRFHLDVPVEVFRLAPPHAPITPAEESGACPVNR